MGHRRGGIPFFCEQKRQFLNITPPAIIGEKANGYYRNNKDFTIERGHKRRNGNRVRRLYRNDPQLCKGQDSRSKTRAILALCK
jgi:hypothetical protein